MSNLVLIFVCLIAGHALKLLKKLPENSGQVLNSIVIQISFPALVLSVLPRLFQRSLNAADVVIPVSMAWIQFALSFLLIGAIADRWNWSRARRGALILTAGLGNTSFIGFPLLDALRGPDAISIGILVDQLGTFLVLSTLGIIVASAHGHRRDGKTLKIWQQVAYFPPFIALMLGLILGLGQFDMPIMIQEILERLASTLVPLAVLAVGFRLQLNTASLKRYRLPLTIGLVFKLVFVPIFMLVLYRYGFSSWNEIVEITILEAAMATMITSAVVASDFNLDEELANLMVGISIPLSLFTVPLWDLVIRSI